MNLRLHEAHENRMGRTPDIVRRNKIGGTNSYSFGTVGTPKNFVQKLKVVGNIPTVVE